MNRIPKAVPSVVTGVFVTGLVMLGVEAGVRLLGIAPALPTQLARYSTSPYLVWGPTPLSHYEGTATTGEYTNDLRHNSLGLRDVEHSFEKPAGTFRILGLGDSFTYGSGAQFEETWLYRVEQALNARPGREDQVEVIKAGVSRFFPEPQRMLLERLGTKYSPDLIVVGFTANDVYDTCLGLGAISVSADGQLMNSPSAELGRFGARLYEYSHAARIVLRAWVSRNFLRRCRFGPELYRANGPFETNWRAVEAEYGRMAAIASGIGARLLIVNIPDRPPWTEDHRYPSMRLGAWARNNGVDFLDALPAMQAAAAAGAQPLYWKADPHCTPAGYAVLADVVANYLATSGRVP